MLKTKTTEDCKTETRRGRPSKISIDAARDVLSHLQTEFFTGDFLTKAANQDFSERTAYRMLDMLEQSCDIIKGEKKRKWIKKAPPERAKIIHFSCIFVGSGELVGDAPFYEAGQSVLTQNLKVRQTMSINLKPACFGTLITAEQYEKRECEKCGLIALCLRAKPIRCAKKIKSKQGTKNEKL